MPRTAPATSAYTYSPGPGASFEIVVSGRPFGEPTREPEELDEASVRRDAWLQLLMRAVDVAVSEAKELDIDAEKLSSQRLAEAGRSPIAVHDWRYPSDVSTEAPSSPAVSTPATILSAESPGTLQEVAAAGSLDAGGIDAVEKRPPKHFEVRAPAPYGGLRFRRSKDMGDVNPRRFAENMSRVSGHLEDGGSWLRVGADLYLPVCLDGKQVLRPRRPQREPPASGASGLFGLTCRGLDCLQEADESDDPFLVKEYEGHAREDVL